MPEDESVLKPIPPSLYLRRFLLGPINAQSTIHQKMIAGGAWSFAFKGVDQVLIFARLVILANILVPGDFGLLGIALITMSALDVLSQAGFQQALIHNKGDIRSYLSVSWTVLAMRGFALFLIIFFTAPYVARFFDVPEAQTILQVIGLSMVFRALSNPGVVYFLKEMDFRKQFYFNFSGTVADFIVAIGAVLVLHNVWALVFGWLAKDLVMLVVSYIIHPFRPQVEFGLNKARGLYRYGNWVFLSGVLMFLVTQGDGVFVGKVLGATALGLYQMAYGLSSAPATEISNVISQVAFPAYSKLQDDIAQLRATFARTQKFMLLLATPLAGAIFILAPEFVAVFLGDKWIGLVPAMEVLAWWGIMRAVIEGAGPLFWALGRPKIMTVLQLLQATVLFTLLLPLIAFADIGGAALAVLLSAIPVFLIINQVIVSTLRLNVADYYRMLLFPFMMTAASFIPVIALRLLHPATDLPTFLLMTAAYALTFLAMSTYVDRHTSFSVWSFVKEESVVMKAETAVKE